MEEEEKLFYRDFVIDVVDTHKLEDDEGNEFEEKESFSRNLRISQNKVGDVGGVVWDSALVACKYLEKRRNAKPEDFIGKSVLELGAGTGICSFTLACLGANVYATDLPDQLELLETNCRLNAAEIKRSFGIFPLTWGNVDDINHLKNLSDGYDWILIIDCLYYEMSTKPLLETLLALSTPGKTQILCVYEEREIGKPKLMVEEFFKLAAEHFQISAIPDTELHPDFIAPEIKSLILTNI